MIYYLLYKIGQFIALVLPLPVSYWLAAKVGFIWSYVNYKARAKVLDNLRVIFGTAKSEEELRKDATEIFVNFGKYLVEFFRLPLINEQYIRQKIKFNNFEIIEAHKKKGFIGVGAHLGNWELGGAILAEMGVKTNVIALVHKYKKIDLFFKRQREIHGLKSIPPGSTSIRNVFRNLKKGEIIALLGDRDFSYSGIEMDFFGKPALIPKGPAFFSLKTGLPIICIFVIREKENSFSFFAEGPIYPTSTEFNEENAKEINKKMINILEKYIKKYHTQWLMFYHLWKIDRREREEII